jgi:Fe-S oxidoreductase
MVEAKEQCRGGMAAFSNPSLAFELLSDIIDAAEATSADALCTACIFCRDNLYRAARRKRSKLKGEHILLFLAKKLK